MKTVYGKRKDLEERAVKIIEKSIKDLLKNKKQVTFGIPGGRSVKRIFKLFKTSKIPWKKVHIFLVDERFVPLTSKDSNYFLACNLFLNNLVKNGKIPQKNIHPFNYKKGIIGYSNELKKFGGKFDVVLLSSGEDCHVESLFPEKSVMKKGNYFITMDNSPKPPKNRMSASKKLLEKSKVSVLLFFNKEKEKAYKIFKDPKISVGKCPAKIVGKINKSYVLVTKN